MTSFLLKAIDKVNLFKKVYLEQRFNRGWSWSSLVWHHTEYVVLRALMSLNFALRKKIALERLDKEKSENFLMGYIRCPIIISDDRYSTRIEILVKKTMNTKRVMESRSLLFKTNFWFHLFHVKMKTNYDNSSLFIQILNTTFWKSE